jgi:holo-[acyl-carrier protein] synthase
MCVIGIGIDLVETTRFKATLARWDRRFIKRVFLEGEQAYCDAKSQPWMHYAARFAVKEAVAKAFATGIGSRLSWLDIEVVRDPATGAPSVALSEQGRALADGIGVRKILISISHTSSHAIAQAVLAGSGGKE